VNIRFLIADAYSVGGTIRTTFVTAGQLAREHEVEVVSVYRFAERPRLELDPRVRLRCLTDLTPQSRQGLRGRIAESPSRVIHSDDTRYPRFNLLTDAALLRFLYSVRDGVLVGTRPALNLAISRHVSNRVVRIGQDHLNLDAYEPGLLSALAECYPKLDAVTALTEGTAARYRELMGQRGRVVCIPNPAPSDRGKRASLDAPVVVAAGTLSRRKGFDRLFTAWAQIAHEFPDWRLVVFGHGPERGRLTRQLDDLGIAGNASLGGNSPRLPEELAKASLFAMTSRREGFPMVLLEAMSVGVPVVAYDCPTGPRDIVSQSVDGYVVRDGDTAQLAATLAELMDDEPRRRRFAVAAVDKARQFDIATIAAQWEKLFEELAAQKRPRRLAVTRR